MRDITTFYEDLIPEPGLADGFKYQPSCRRTGRCLLNTTLPVTSVFRPAALVSKSYPTSIMAASSQSMAFFIFFLALCCCSLAHAHPSVHRHRSLSSPKPLLSRVHETPESATIQTAGESVIVPVPEDQRGEASPQRGLLPENVRVQMQTLLDSPLFETSDKIIDLHPPTIVIPEQRLGRRHGGPSSYGFPWPGSDNDLETKLSTLQDTLNELIPLLQEYIVQVPAESPAASASTAIVALTGTITSTLDTEPTPTSSLAPEVSLTTTGAPSATPTAVTTPANYIFNPTSQSNNAVYYGQLRTNPTLSDVCADPNIDIIIISFLSYLTNTPPANATGSVATAGWPTLNVAAHCWAPTVAQNAAGAGTLVDCVGSGFSQKVQTCQQSGKKVLLSLGGAVGYSNTVLASADVATAVAQNVWDLFLGGGHDLDGIKPFGPDVVFDGIGELANTIIVLGKIEADNALA